MNLLFWTALFITSLTVANVVAGKIVVIGSLMVPAAVVAYGITFLCTDIIDEKYGKEKANHVVRIGFITQIFASLLILMAQHLPVAPFGVEVQKAYNILLGQNWRFVLASLAAYLVSQHFDVWFFNLLKGKFKAKWIRNNVSTILSQLLDTVIFITIAFVGKTDMILVLVCSQFLIKVGIAIVDTPIFYFFTRKD